MLNADRRDAAILRGTVTTNRDVMKRADALERLLTLDESVHPPACMCAIKSRVVEHHASDCPYRMALELIVELRAMFREEKT